MGLEPPSPHSPDEAKDSSGRTVIIHRGDDSGSHAVLVRRDDFERFLLHRNLGCLWFVSGERSAWPNGNHDGSTRRWFGSLVQFDGSKTNRFDWETPW
jgi:hypothetical protein